MILRFACKSIEHQAIPQKDGPVKHHYAVRPDLFELACRMFRVPTSQWAMAHDWCELVAHAATDAPEVAAAPKHRRRGELKRVGDAGRGKAPSRNRG